jgi:hypothetical protein
MYGTVLYLLAFFYFAGLNFWYMLASWLLLIPDYQLLEAFEREGLITPGFKFLKFAYRASVIVEGIVYPVFDFTMLVDTSQFSVVSIVGRILTKIILRTVITLTLRVVYTTYLAENGHDLAIVEYAQQKGIVIPKIKFSGCYDRITGPFDLDKVARFAVNDVNIESHTGIRTMVWPEPTFPINAPIMLFSGMILYFLTCWLVPLIIFADWVSDTRKGSLAPVVKERCTWRCYNKSRFNRLENCENCEDCVKCLECENCGNPLNTKWKYTPCTEDYSCPSLSSASQDVLDPIKAVWHQPDDKCITISTLYTFVWLNNIDWTSKNSYYVRTNVEKLRLPAGCEALVYRTKYTITKKGKDLLPCDLSDPLYYCTMQDIIQLDL